MFASIIWHMDFILYKSIYSFTEKIKLFVHIHTHLERNTVRTGLHGSSASRNFLPHCGGTCINDDFGTNIGLSKVSPFQTHMYILCTQESSLSISCPICFVRCYFADKEGMAIAQWEST